MRIGADQLTPEPDIVAVILQKIMQAAPGIGVELVQQVEREVRAQYGGQRLFVPKGAKRMTPEQRQAIYQDGLTAMADETIIEKHKISKTTLWRVMKGGGGRFS